MFGGGAAVSALGRFTRCSSALATLPSDFAGWVIVEVDVPRAPSNLESAQISAAWVVDHYGPDVCRGDHGNHD